MYNLNSTWGWAQVPQVLLIRRWTLLAMFALLKVRLHKERLLCFCILNNTQHSVIHYVLL